MAEEVDVTEIARQVAEQIADQIGQSVSQAITKLLQTQAATTGVSATETRIEDIGGGERYTKESADNSALLFSNQKRTYDEYQQESLESIKRNRSYVDKVLSDAHGYDMNARNVATQALQNAVETANMIGKQAVAHRDLAIDREWNVDEQGWTVDKLARYPFWEDLVKAVATEAAKKDESAK